MWDREDPRRKRLIARRCTTADAVANWVVEISKESGKQDGSHGHHGHSGLDGRSSVSITSMPSRSSTTGSAYPEIAANAALTLIVWWRVLFSTGR